MLPKVCNRILMVNVAHSANLMLQPQHENLPLSHFFAAIVMLLLTKTDTVKNTQMPVPGPTWNRKNEATSHL